MGNTIISDESTTIATMSNNYLPGQKIAFLAADIVDANALVHKLPIKKREEKGQIIVLSDKQLVEFPRHIFEAHNLTWLDISHNSE